MTDQGLIARGTQRARLAGERAVARFTNGLDYFMGRHDDVVEPEPYDVVLQRDKLTLRSYRPDPPAEVAALPVLFIPPLMVRPLVYDLRAGHSFVGEMRRSGLHPYIVDFGNPDLDDREMRLDTYVLEWLPEVIEAMRADSGQDRYAMVGYCMGGLFALMTAAANVGTLAPPAAIVTIGAPIDSAKMGALTVLARLGARRIDLLTRAMGNVPGKVSSAAFKLMMPVRTLTRKADLFLNLYDEEWIRGYESLEAWTGGFLDYPGAAFAQFVQDFMARPKLRDGSMEFGDRTADLAAVICPVLAFAGKDDKLVPIRSARAALGSLGSADVRFRVVPGGHMGVVAGLRAPANVWEPTRSFLADAAAG